MKLNSCWRPSVAALLITLSPSLFAETSCAISTVSAVNFGIYDVFSPITNNNGIGSITIQCQGGGTNLLVSLSRGQSNNFASRIMRNGGEALNYNLYTSAARTVVWGDGTGGSSAMTVNKNSTSTLSIFGQIPAGQDVAVGTYSDNITMIISF